ncbi:hypothetical protein BR93DRAFT_959605 [Coniochaeta sp. PMI_546]|nr:hypothetical protein BR93DRAFT_959605 [Coniochaeta sp. PMI_546]
MSDVQKPVEVAPPVEPVAESKVEETPAATTEAAPATETPAPAVEATTAAEETPAAPAAEESTKKEETTPVEEGHLEHKGSNFPKNFLYSKKFFWFGSEPVDTKAASTFKHDKVADVAHHVAAWASETGKGLLFFSERADKTAPHGAIQLAEATEPAAEGTHKFHFTSKGHKHTFKAGSTAERDNWVSQLKLKIAEAKELAKTIPETETYKKTLESFKPKKEEKAAVVAAPVAAEPAAETTATEETPKAVEPAVPAVEEPKKEEPKRRSASRKRGSIFGGSLFGKKEEAKKEEEKPVEAAAETKAAETEAPAAETSAVATEAPAAETPAVVATEPATEVTPAEVVAPAAETKAEEPKTEETKTEAKPAEHKPKRGSIFGTLSFGKKSKATSPERTPAPAAEETPVTTEAVAETAPVIPAVETTEPLSAEVSSPATVPTETVEAGSPATNGEIAASKKEVKSEKRKSSLPFGLGAKKEKATSDEETEKPKSPSPFSKLRQTINRKAKSDKPAEKAAEKPAEDKPVEAEPTAAEPAKEEPAVKPAETEAPAAVEESAPADKPLAATPTIQAAA